VIAKRIAALVAAAGLIVGAILLRHSLDNTSSTNTASPNTTSPAASVHSVICSTEFADVCQQLGNSYRVTVEPAGTTLDRLANAAVADLPDAWLTLDPYPAMLDDTRSRSGLTAAIRDSIVVGVTDPSLAMVPDRATSFQAACGTSPAWRCIGDFAGTAWSDHQGQTGWGTIKPALNDPATQASGLLQFANAVAGYFNSINFDRGTWESDARFSSWLRNLGANTLVTATGTTPLSTLLVRQSALNIASTSQAEVAQIPPSGGTKTTEVVVAPTIEFSATLAHFTNAENKLIDGKLSTTIGSLLQAHYGWRVPPGTKLLLPAGTFIALRQLWKDAT
jgi:hypothetical protein